MHAPNIDRERGQSIILIVVLVAILLALVALVVDVGNAYAQRRIVKNAVDAASLAGTRQLAEHGLGNPPKRVFQIRILQKVRDYAEANGLARDDVEAWFIDAAGVRRQGWKIRNTYDYPPAEAEGVEVEGSLTFDTYFAHLLGFPILTVYATTPSWKLHGPCNMDGLFPITLQTTAFNPWPPVPPFGYDHVYTIWDTDDPNEGNFGWIHWGDVGSSTPPVSPPKEQGPTAETLKWNMHFTERSNEWWVGDWVPGSVGVQFTGPIQDELEFRIKQCDPVDTPGCVWDDLRPPAVLIPIYGDDRGGGMNKEYQIAAFARFRLLCYHHSNSKEVEYEEGVSCNIPHTPEDKYVRGYLMETLADPFADGCVGIGFVAASFRNPHAPAP